MAGRSPSLWTVAAIVVMAGAARGADGPEAGGKFASLIGDLRSNTFATREAATHALLRLGTEERPEIEQALARETDLEAAARLERVAVHLYMKERTPLEGDIGVLGITLKLEAVQLDPKLAKVQLAIVVMKTQPGFPAAEWLEVMDRIVGVNGNPLSIQSDEAEFRKQINETKPGSPVRLTVLRDGKVLDIPVRVAGLRTNDAPLFGAIVHSRDVEAEQYLVGLKRGAAARTLTVANEPAAGGERRIEGVLPAETIAPP